MIADGRQRLDKWLWFARMVKSRTLAAGLISEGHVRINRDRQITPAKIVKVGDVLTISLEQEVRVLKVLLPGTRRGPFEEARQLYEDLTPTKSESPADHRSAQARGSRPSKKDRRDMEAFRSEQSGKEL